jgi:hypothetical protein
VLFGLLMGLYGFATFFMVLGVSIEPVGPAAAFAMASSAALLVQGGSLLAIRRTARHAAKR